MSLAIAELFELLSTPEHCIPYLKFLNHELKNYFQQKHGRCFPELMQELHFVPINSTPYPVPQEDYQGIKKSHALQEVLVAIFRNYDKQLAQQAYKWIGFVPHETGNQLVSAGAFFTENRVGGNLFHGKLSHMIQQLLCIYAIQDGRIKLREGINLKDILTELVTTTSVRGIALWTEVCDYRKLATRLFHDPFGLNSFIMEHREYFPELSDSVTDSFCKGFLYYKKLHQEVVYTSPTSSEEFVEQLNDIKLHKFFGTSRLNQHEKMREKNELNTLAQNKGKDYAIVSKHYEPLETFTPREYRCLQ